MYSFSINLNGGLEETAARVTEALGKEGFGILTEINVHQVFKKKLDLDMRPYRILGACNPNLARQAIEADADVGLLLPCNVLLREEEDGTITVGFMDPAAVLAIAGHDNLAALGKEVKERLERVRDSLA